MKYKKNILLAGTAMIIFFAYFALNYGGILQQVQNKTATQMILIDPGHGGMDGGASGSDGTLEKDINLAISEKLRLMAEENGLQVIMTREDDNWLCESEEGSIRSRKTADLRARSEMLADYEPDIAVSIHLNSFKEDPDVKGVQVFYPPNSEGDFADIMQDCLNETLEVDRARTPMTRDGVFIFREIVCPILIIECGFLSNPEELQLLKDENYQEQIAEGILQGIMEYTGWKKPANVEIIDSLD